MNGFVNFDDFKWITRWLREDTTQDFLDQWRQRPAHERKRVLAWLTTNELMTRAFEKKFELPLYHIMYSLISITHEPVPDDFWLHCLRASDHVSLFMMENIIVTKSYMIDELLKRLGTPLKRWHGEEMLYLMCSNDGVPKRYIEQVLRVYDEFWTDRSFIDAYDNTMETNNTEAKHALISFMTGASREHLLLHCCRNEYWDDAKMIMTDYRVPFDDRTIALCKDNKDMMAFLFPKRIKI